MSALRAHQDGRRLDEELGWAVPGSLVTDPWGATFGVRELSRPCK
ncbi:MAG TPA: hypothetical protein VH373_20455 [Jatrophihabitantaceae bacterium]